MRAHPQHLQTAGSCICRAGFIILTISVINVRNSGGFLLTYLGVALITVKQCSLSVGSGSKASTRPISLSTRQRVEETVWGCSEFPWLKPGVCFTRGPGTYKQGHPGRGPRCSPVLQILQIPSCFSGYQVDPLLQRRYLPWAAQGDFFRVSPVAGPGRGWIPHVDPLLVRLP